MDAPSRRLTLFELAEQFDLQFRGDGDTLILTEVPEGGYRLTPYDPEFDRQMEIAEEGIRKYRNTLRELAK